MDVCKPRAMWALAALLGFVLGCNQESDQPPPPLEKEHVKKPVVRINRPTQTPEKVTEKIDVVEEPPPSSVPRVTLSGELLATCLVKVGDTLPDAELTDTAGKTQTLTKLFGSKLTVVFTWMVESEYAEEALEDLDADVAKPYAEKGVKVVGINLHDSPEEVREVVQKAGAAFPILVDADGKYFGKIATDKPLRTYLLDARGKILWFDVEYSRSTRRDLHQAIEAVLGPVKPS